jgi:hypothetical protein
MIWATDPVPFNKVEDAIKRLESVENETDHDRVVFVLREIVPEYNPANKSGGAAAKQKHEVAD